MLLFTSCTETEEFSVGAVVIKAHQTVHSVDFPFSGECWTVFLRKLSQ